MRLYYGMADREPHSDALRFRGKEWLKDAVCQARLDSWSRILNLDRNTIWVLCRPDQNFPPPICGRTRCFNSVHDQVNQYLLQLHRVAGQAEDTAEFFQAWNAARRAPVIS